MNEADSHESTSAAIDPVRRRRSAIARWTAVASRIGYALYAMAIALFITAFIADFSRGFATAITVCLIIGTILLAPAIVLGYAITAAERDDEDVARRRREI